MKGKQHREIQDNGRKSTKTNKQKAEIPSTTRTMADHAVVPGLHSSSSDCESPHTETQSNWPIPCTDEGGIAIFTRDDVHQPALENVLNECWSRAIPTVLFSEQAGRVVGSQGMSYEVHRCPPAADVALYKAIVFLLAGNATQFAQEMPCTTAFLRAAILAGIPVHHNVQASRWIYEMISMTSVHASTENIHLLEGALFINGDNGHLELLHPIHRQ